MKMAPRNYGANENTKKQRVLNSLRSVSRSDKEAPSCQKNYQEESGTRSKPSSFSIIAVEIGNNKIKLEVNVGVNCCIFEFKV